MEDFIPRALLNKIPKSKRALFMWEPIGKTEDNDYFSSVYTFNDDLVGTQKIIANFVTLNALSCCQGAQIPSRLNKSGYALQ